MISGWKDLLKAVDSCSARVEGRSKPRISLERVSAWSVDAGGRQDLVCDYWAHASATRPVGVRFRNGNSSERLALTVGLIVETQDQITRRADACRNGLVLIYPPAEDERKEAITWTGMLYGTSADSAVRRLKERSLSRRWQIESREESH